MVRRLTLEETKNCLRAWREFSDKEALELLMVCNGGLVKYYATKYMGKGIAFDDLQSAGNEGLLKAINKFDYVERKMDGFSSYISVSIENAISLELRRFYKHAHVLSFDQPIKKHKNGDVMTTEELVGTDAEQLFEKVLNDMRIDIVREAFQSLASREKQIILLRYGLNGTHRKTQKEIAEIFGCAQNSISVQEKNALVKMRNTKNMRKILSE